MSPQTPRANLKICLDLMIQSFFPFCGNEFDWWNTHLMFIWKTYFVGGKGRYILWPLFIGGICRRGSTDQWKIRVLYYLMVRHQIWRVLVQLQTSMNRHKNYKWLPCFALDSHSSIYYLFMIIVQTSPSGRMASTKVRLKFRCGNK